MKTDCDFYICPTCFKTAESRQTCHGHPMRHCQQMPLGDKRLGPPRDEQGNLKSRAPRWFLDVAASEEES